MIQRAVATRDGRTLRRRSRLWASPAPAVLQIGVALA